MLMMMNGVMRGELQSSGGGCRGFGWAAVGVAARCSVASEQSFLVASQFNEICLLGVCLSLTSLRLAKNSRKETEKIAATIRLQTLSSIYLSASRRLELRLLLEQQQWQWQ